VNISSTYCALFTIIIRAPRSKPLQEFRLHPASPREVPLHLRLAGYVEVGTPHNRHSERRGYGKPRSPVVALRSVPPVTPDGSGANAIRGHRRICSKSYGKRYRGMRSVASAGPNLLFERFGRPDVAAAEADVVPSRAKRCGARNFVGQRFLGREVRPAPPVSIVPRSRSVTGSRAACCPQRAARHTGRARRLRLPRHSKRGIMPEPYRGRDAHC
jgi:hypothetical protein